jgi:hypothetical protein
MPTTNDRVLITYREFLLRRLDRAREDPNFCIFRDVERREYMDMDAVVAREARWAEEDRAAEAEDPDDRSTG